MSQDECEQVAGFSLNVNLSPTAIEVLEQLFFHGPTWDGNIISKSGRDELFDLKLAGRVEGYSFLMPSGVRMALNNRLERKKESSRRRERERLSKLSEIEDILNPRPAKPTVDSLEKILSTPESAA